MDLFASSPVISELVDVQLLNITPEYPSQTTRGGERQGSKSVCRRESARCLAKKQQSWPLAPCGLAGRQRYGCEIAEAERRRYHLRVGNSQSRRDKGWGRYCKVAIAINKKAHICSTPYIYIGGFDRSQRAHQHSDRRVNCSNMLTHAVGSGDDDHLILRSQLRSLQEQLREQPARLHFWERHSEDVGRPQSDWNIHGSGVSWLQNVSGTMVGTLA